MWNPKYLSIFEKKFRLSVCTLFLSSGIAVHSGGPVVNAWIQIFAGVGSIPTKYGSEFFCIFFHLSC